MWDESAVPEQHGRVAVITGGSAGIGLQTARVLAQRGASVVITSPDETRARRAAAQLPQAAQVHAIGLDLADPASVEAAADAIGNRWPRLDLLINNAGVMDVPWTLTGMGVESTFAVNHLGHFALTGRLIDRMRAVPGARVVTVSSEAHAQGQICFSDINRVATRDRGQTYSQSKLANVLFALELDRRLRETGAHARALVAHPGIVRSGLWTNSAWWERGLLSPRLRWITRGLVQDPAAGALPVLRAACDLSADGGEFYAPAKTRTGPPVAITAAPQAQELASARRLWALSEELSGVHFLAPHATARDA